MKMIPELSVYGKINHKMCPYICTPMTATLHCKCFQKTGCDLVEKLVHSKKKRSVQRVQGNLRATYKEV